MQRLDGVRERLQRGYGVAAEARQVRKRAEAGELREHVDQGDQPVHRCDRLGQALELGGGVVLGAVGDGLELGVAELGRAVLGLLDAHLLVDEGAQLTGQPAKERQERIDEAADHERHGELRHEREELAGLLGELRERVGDLARIEVGDRIGDGLHGVEQGERHVDEVEHGRERREGGVGLAKELLGELQRIVDAEVRELGGQRRAAGEGDAEPLGRDGKLDAEGWEVG